MSAPQAEGRAYSDAWHRVAGVRLRLRRSVRSHRQHFRGQPWVVLSDSMGSDHFRLAPSGYAFVSQLDGQRSVDQVWSDWMDRAPEDALTQEEIVQLLAQLQMANLLQFDRGSEAASLFERFGKRQRQERLAWWMGLLSIKLPLWDPDRALARAMPLIRECFGPWGLGAYAVLLLLGAKAVLDHAEQLFAQGQGLLAPDNLGLLYLGTLVAKTVHELGHAAACKRFGGEVHKMGVMLLIFAPLPYMDATAAWGFRHRGERLLVGAAGVLSELAVAAVAALVWANTAPGALHALAYNVIFVASVSTVLFNLNPLLRFDGYHMLVDVLDIPNLYQRSREQLKYLAEAWLLRLPQAQAAAHSRAEAWWLPIYGLSSLAYWLVLMSGIVFFVAKQYLLLGQALALVLVFTAVVWPLVQLLRYLFKSPKLGQRRAAVGLRVMAGLGGVCGVVLLVPMPDRIRLDGVVQAQASRSVFAQTPGRLQRLVATPGTWVEAGAVLIEQINPELDFQIESLRQQRDQLLAQELQAMSEQVANLAPLRRQRLAVEQQWQERVRSREALRVTAPMAGRWAALPLTWGQGQWLAKGAVLGTLVDDHAWRFVAVLPQVSSYAFDGLERRAQVRLRGQEDQVLAVQQVAITPFEQGQLPSAALGMAGGGAIAVDPQDAQGLTASEPFFRVQADFGASLSGSLRHGQRGVMRLSLPPTPLWQQWARGLRQFLQREFRV